MFEIPAGMLSWFYAHTGNSLIIAIALMSVVIMAITTPLTLKSTKGMLEMQRLTPEMKRLQNEYRDDRQKLNEEMMKLYQENKVNPMTSCLPIFAQMPVFIVMFRILRGMTYTPNGRDDTGAIANATSAAVGGPEEFTGFIPRYMARGSELFQALYRDTEIYELGIDLSLSPFNAIQDNPLKGVIYALLVVILGGLYFGQQRMVAARAAVNPTMSPVQQKLMQYLPVAFAVFQIFFLTALVVYYIFQTLLRILQQYYITKRFYGSDESLGRQAQRAGETAREEAKKNGESEGLFGPLRDQAARNRDTAKKEANKRDPKTGQRYSDSKRVTPPKNRPTTKRGESSGKGRPTPSRSEAQGRRNRPNKSGKKKR